MTGLDIREDTSSNSATTSKDSTSTSEHDESSDDKAIITGSMEYEAQRLEAREQIVAIEREDIPIDFENEYSMDFDSADSSDSNLEDNVLYSDLDDDFLTSL